MVTVTTSLTILDSEKAAEFVDPLDPASGLYVLVAVRDTGRDIAEDLRRRIFDPLFTTKPEGEESGLGLSVVYGIIMQHGGHLALETQLGKGSTFKLYLPSVGAPPANPSVLPMISNILGGRETVLLVEDEYAVRDVTSRIMTRLGYKVLATDCAESALELIAQDIQDIDLLFTDLVMPGMDGMSLAREILKRRPGIRVMFASGYSPDHLDKDPELASLPLLKKPFEAAELAHMVRRVLDGTDQRPGAKA